MSIPAPVTRFIDSLVEVFIPADGCPEPNHLKNQLLHFVRIEAQPNKVSNLFRTITNGLSHIRNNSDWCRTKEMLKRRSMQVIVDHFEREERQDTLALKADALSEFVLRYLVTYVSRTSQEQEIKQYFDDKQWRYEGLDKMTIDDLIERAIHGNGYHLPAHRVADLLHLIGIEKKRLKQGIECLSASAEKKETLESLLHKLPIKDFVIDQLTKYVIEHREYLALSNWTDRTDAANFPGRQDSLVKVLHQVRSKRREFFVVEQMWGQILAYAAQSDKSNEGELFFLQNICRFSWKRIKPLIDYLEEIVERHSEPTYAYEDLSQSVVEEVYAPDCVRDFIATHKRIKEETKWVDAAVKSKEDFRQALSQIYQSIVELETKILQVKSDLEREDAFENIDLIPAPSSNS